MGTVTEQVQLDFLKKDEIRTPDEEIDVRLVLAENLALKEENSELKEQLAWFKKQVYGQKTEKSEVVLADGSEQVPMFNEAEQEADVHLKSVQTTEVKAHKRVKRTRDEIMGDLPVEEVFHEVEDKTCEKCGAEMVVIGKEKIRDELVYEPAKLYIRRHIAEVVKCTACGMDESRDADLSDVEKCHIRRAEVPAPMIPHSFCTPELLAHIVYEKYFKAVPLHRLEKEFAAKGGQLSRTTMANWIIMAAEMWVRPVWEQMHRELLASSVIHADETVVQVLNEPGRKAKTDSRMWVYCAQHRKYQTETAAGCAPELAMQSPKSNILFEYQPTRNGDHASKFLGDYHNYLVCDGYDGYNKLKNAVRCGCWAHVRRKFVDALPSDKELLPTSMAAVGVEYCNKLFMLEREFAELTSQERYIKRQEKSKIVLDEFFAWAEKILVSGGTKLSKAVSYAKAERKYLCRFLESGEIPIDNNHAENAVRPFCIGRKNWLFSASVKGAEASAMMYSVVAAACANGMDVEGYLAKLFRCEAGTVVLPW